VSQKKLDLFQFASSGVAQFYPTVAAAYEHFTGSSSKTSG
jgi:hypothetical protein